MFLDVLVQFVVVDGMSMHGPIGMCVGDDMAARSVIVGMGVAVGHAMVILAGLAGGGFPGGDQRSLQDEGHRRDHHDDGRQPPQIWPGRQAHGRAS